MLPELLATQQGEILYVIQTSHKDKDDTVSRSMDFQEACVLYGSLTGEDVSDLQEGEEVSDGFITLREARIEELIYMEDGVLIVDNIIAKFSDDRFNIAWKRAAKEFNGLEPDPDDMESEFGESFAEEYHHQLELMAAKELFGYFEQEGFIRNCGVDEDGQIKIEVTERGSEVYGL
jgi:hypothetical protein